MTTAAGTTQTRPSLALDRYNSIPWAGIRDPQHICTLFHLTPPPPWGCPADGFQVWRRQQGGAEETFTTEEMATLDIVAGQAAAALRRLDDEAAEGEGRTEVNTYVYLHVQYIRLHLFTFEVWFCKKKKKGVRTTYHMYDTRHHRRDFC